MESRAVEEHVDAILKHTYTQITHVVVDKHFSTAPPGVRSAHVYTSVLHMLSSTIESVYYERAPIKKHVCCVCTVHTTRRRRGPRATPPAAGPAPRIPCNIS